MRNTRMNKVKKSMAVTKAEKEIRKRKNLEAIVGDRAAVLTAENSVWMQEQVAASHKHTRQVRAYLNKKFPFSEILDEIIFATKNRGRPATQLQGAKMLIELAGFLSVEKQAYLRIGTRDMEDARDIPQTVFRIEHLPSLEALPPPDGGVVAVIPMSDQDDEDSE